MYDVGTYLIIIIIISIIYNSGNPLMALLVFRQHFIGCYAVLPQNAE